MRTLTGVTLGPNPYRSLLFIDRLGLYRTIFPGSDDHATHSADTRNWPKAYNQARDLMSKWNTPDHPMKIINSVLLAGQDDLYHMWLLCALVPWARVPPTPPKKATSKTPPTPAATAARDGIKADNHTIKVIDNAAAHLMDIIQVKDATAGQGSSTSSPLKRKRESVSREIQGMAIRRWGATWRSSVVYALLTQASEVAEESKSIVRHMGFRC